VAVMEESNPLDMVFAVNDKLDYEVDDRQLVTVLVHQDHWIQRIARRLRLRIPDTRKIRLDEYCSYVLLCLDGKRTVKEVGELMVEKFGDQANPVYERLFIFLNHIEKTERYIVRVAIAN